MCACVMILYNTHTCNINQLLILLCCIRYVVIGMPDLMKYAGVEISRA
uniref:Uncharacterized protein n=1 Tax=Arundo donax TaxID=35708 RepID=A0A0A9A552_ARUDO